MPKVSVIIPTFNRAWILQQAIDSVLSQTFTDFEIIVVDDGSTDNTAEILKSYPQVTRLRQAHSGVSAARNAGIDAAQGAFISFLDSDDLWLPGKLSAQIKFFNDHPDAVICQTEEIWIRRGVRVNPKIRHRKCGGMIFESGLHLCLVSPSAVMMKRALFDEVGRFDERLSVCEDYDLWLRVSCRFPVHLVKEPLVIKRGGHPDQLSCRHSQDRYRVHALKKILESGRLTPGQSAAALAVLTEKCRIYAQGCRKRGRVDEAEEYRRIAEEFAGPR